jgi:integrase
MPLTDTFIKAVKFTGKPKKYTDMQTLYLLVNASSKLWRMDYVFADRRKTLALGQYPDTTLAQARKRRDEARALLADGVDPMESKKAARAALKAKHDHTFGAVAIEWLNSIAEVVTPETHARTAGWLKKDVLPFIGKKPVSDVKAADVLTVLNRLNDRKARDSMARVKQYISRVLKYAIAEQLIDRNVTQDLAIADKFPKPKTVSHAAITEPMAFGALLRAIHGYQGGPVATAALKLAPLVFLRPGELRHAEWTEIDLDAGLWVVPATKTKMRQALTVPLSLQAREILEQIKPFSGHGRYVFPSNRGQGKPMSENTTNAALRGLGYGPDVHVGHGFRASARTMLDQELKFDVRFIEMQLGHMVKDANAHAYNRASFIPERTLMMQAWADYLDSLRTGAKIIDFDRKAA